LELIQLLSVLVELELLPITYMELQEIAQRCTLLLLKVVAVVALTALSETPKVVLAVVDIPVGQPQDLV
jgi:hypothetical protein